MREASLLVRLVVDVVGAGGLAGGLGGLVQCPAKLRRALLGELAQPAAAIGALDADVDGRVIPRGCLAFRGVRWWSCIRFTRLLGGGLRCCWRVARVRAACMCATVARWAGWRWPVR